MKIFKVEQWNIDLLLPLFEQYRIANGMAENPERTLTFLKNRIRFSESILFIALDKRQSAVGFIQLYPRISSFQLQRYWQLSDIFVIENARQQEIYRALIEKAKEFVQYTQSTRLIVEHDMKYQALLEQQGFRHNPNKGLFELSLQG